MTRLIVRGLIVVAFCGTQLCFAGNEGGAGGDGVLLGEELFPIDLVEAGIENNPYIDSSLENHPALPGVILRLEVPLRPLNDPEAIRMVAIKLIEISRVSIPLALTLLQTIEAYRWVLVNHSLVDVKDEDTVLEIGAGKLVQLAIRRLHSVMVSRDSWGKLRLPIRRTALVVHEAAYAAMSLFIFEQFGPKDVK